MPQNTHLEIISAESERLRDPAHTIHDPRSLHRKAEALASELAWLPNPTISHVLADETAAVTRALKPILAQLDGPIPQSPISDDFRWLYDNSRLFYTELQNVNGLLRQQKKLPYVRDAHHHVLPRVLALGRSFLESVSYDFNEQEFTLFVDVFQKTSSLQLRELWALVSVLKLVLLEQVAQRGALVLRDPSDNSSAVGTCIRSLREIGQISWKDALDPLIEIDKILRQDPAGAYASMDFESRDLYRNKVSNIADHSDFSEIEVAGKVLALAQDASKRNYADPRIALRESHVGFYLLDKGAPLIQRKMNFRPPFGQRIQSLLRRYPDEFFLLGIQMMSVAIMAAMVFYSTDPGSSIFVILFSMLALLLPCSQSAVQLMNQLITSLLPPEILPKLDFSGDIPDDCLTMVAVPSLLLNEKQVRGLVEDLEVRFLGNHDPNIHFALLTDLPDTREPAREDSPLIALCADLIHQLNAKYAAQGMGSFYMFHRHRVYNPRERAWMGWERKRGKLLDLNKLLRGQYDSFPVKVGELSLLPQIRYVITLDADTELPRGTARRMIGTLAHPLNQAVIDPEKNIVVTGYGILQPRVGVSVQSTTTSRLAAIYAGETGFDIYTRAVSDAYQDLYSEGSFTGKGIYEVDTVHRVLDQRFPRNALLSHDLIEGAYARAGLASDIEVIEDYPSHYSAYNRRKHRWLRGDWQIAGWLLPRVPEESADRVANPISLLSWWKILDNLRRSLVEPAMFMLLVAGWLLPVGQAWRWTIAAVCILFLPTWLQFAINLAKAVFFLNLTIARDAFSSFYNANVGLLFTLIFIAHQTMLSVDAVVRALIRRFVTRQHLLEWETAAEAELGHSGRTPVDVYLNWTPALALCLGLLVWAVRPHALQAALPILVLWASCKVVALWLNRSPFPPRNRASAKDVMFLRRCAMRTWRYFAELSTEEHNWLIPDNIQEQPEAVAFRVSPTNIGLLLNARQVACEFGYLTVPEFVSQTGQTMAAISRLKKHNGHLLNWYDTRTLEPLLPRFVSSVDSGNLLASLWTLQQGCLDRLRQPVLQPCLAEGLLDYLHALVANRILSRKVVRACQRQSDTDNWLQSILNLSNEVLEKAHRDAASPKRVHAKWIANEALARLCSIRKAVDSFAPWLSPEFASLRGDETLNLKLMDTLCLEDLPEFIQGLAERTDWVRHSRGTERREIFERFHERLFAARSRIIGLIAELRKLATEAGRLADEMDFGFLLNKQRKLLSVGYDLETRRVHTACYDLLGTESRTAVFCAIAKEDIPQESWFLLGRAHTLDHGRPVLLSWTGTLFEYLMPSLWMRSYSNTLLERSRIAAVRAQQTYAANKGLPWGISESAYSKLDESGNYQYYAFGLQHLALRKREVKGVVISPYSTFLALDVEPGEAMRNLRVMENMGWFGSYGFYEAADFSVPRRKFWKKRYQLVGCWMAHHQGMSLLSLGNFLNKGVVQRWFHAERRVQATELLLHEKPVAHVRRKDIPRKMAAA